MFFVQLSFRKFSNRVATQLLSKSTCFVDNGNKYFVFLITQTVIIHRFIARYQIYILLFED